MLPAINRGVSIGKKGETFQIGLTLEHLKAKNPDFHIRVLGFLVLQATQN